MTKLKLETPRQTSADDKGRGAQPVLMENGLAAAAWADYSASENLMLRWMSCLQSA